MNIGIDIDETINNYHTVMERYLFEDYGIRANSNEYELFSDLKPEEIKLFLDRHKYDVVEDMKLLPFAFETMQSMLQQDNQIYLITARSYAQAEETMLWLNKHKVPYTDIYFNCFKKHEVCLWKQVDVMIEDAVHNLIDLSKHNIPLIVFDHVYNRQNYNELLRSNNWKEIGDFLDFYQNVK